MVFLVLFLFCFSCSASIEDKVGQLLIAYFDGEEVNERALQLLQDARISGIIYYKWANGLHSPEHVKVLSENLQKVAKELNLAPLFISIDQEGGRVSHLKDGFTSFPSNSTITNEDQAYQNAYKTGLELKNVGININFAPVLDVNTRNNAIIGDRSFGNDPHKVAQFGKKAVDGYIDAEIIPVIKHFPGHGDVSRDSHLCLPVVNKNFDELKLTELVPFEALISHSPMIMTAHVLYPQLDTLNCATLSPHILKDLLRNKMGYKGIIISDSLTMKGVTPIREHICDVAIKAFTAGCDLLLIGGWDLTERADLNGNIEMTIKVHKALVEAVKSGKISDARLNESIARITQLKKQIN